MESTSLSEVLAQAQAELVGGDARAAFSTIRPALDYPAAQLDGAAAITAAFDGFARIAGAIAGAELAAVLQAVAAGPDDPNALYQAGFALYEQQLFGIAATVLARADRLAPRQPRILSELAAALEGAMRYGDAALAVDASGLAESDPLLAYLSGYNWIMVGEIDRAAARLPVLADVRDDTLVHMRDALGGMVRRAQAVRSAGIDLGEHALTAWHAILNGTLLMHESPFGYDEPMRGRYAMVADSPGLMHEGIDRLGRILRALALAPERVIRAPDRASSILAAAVGRAFDRPVVDWSAEDQRGLVVVWSLEELDAPALLRAMFAHRPGQILFAHASNWVTPFGYAPDVTTLLGQTITHPFTGGALRVDPATQQVVPAQPDLRDDATLAAAILAASIDSPSQTPIEPVLAIARALAELPSADRLGLGRTTGNRLRQRAGSPVHSARFL